MEFLTEEEQYKEILSDNEISRIKDTTLREIRFKYWRRRHEAFLDEQQIRDEELGEVYNKIRREEAQEIEAYRLNINKK